MTNPILSGQRLLADTMAVPDTLAAHFPRLEEEVARALADVELDSKRLIVLSGSGDLLHAALSTRMAIERLTGITTLALPSMQLGLYHALGLDQSCLVIQMSFSGITARAVEAATLVKQRGCEVWSITADPASPLATIADRHILKPPTGENEAVGFSVTMAMLLLIGARIGEAAGNLSRASAAAFGALLRNSPADMAGTIAAAAKPAESCAAAIADAPHLLFLASGPTYGTAVNATARIMEAAGTSASAQDIEEWVHLERWIADKRLPVVLIAPPGPGLDRAREVSHALKALGKRQIVVTDDRRRFPDADMHLPVQGGLPEELAPLIYNLPCELLADFLCKAGGRSPYCSDDPAYAELGEIRWGGHVLSKLPAAGLPVAAAGEARGNR